MIDCMVNPAPVFMGLEESVAPAAGGGGVDAPTLAALSTFKADATEAGLAVYTTADGTTQAVDGDNAKAFVPQKMHADDTRWRATAAFTAAKFRDNAGDNINGAPVIEITGSDTAFAKTGSGSGYMSLSKYWFVISGRTHNDASFNNYRAVFAWAGGGPPSNIGASNALGVEVKPGSSKLKIVHVRAGQTPALVESSEISYVRGSVYALGAYYDGTDLHVWYRDSGGLRTETIASPGDVIVSGALAENLHFFAGNNTGAGYGWDLSAFLCGSDDDNDVTAHKARILAWVNDRMGV